MTGDRVRLDWRGEVALVRLNERETLNAMSAKMIDELHRVLDEAADRARAMVLIGEGRAFCAGAKLEKDLPEDLGHFLETHVNPLMNRLRGFPLPWIAAARGACAGVGSSLALLADVVVAGESAYFLQVFVRIGLVPDGGAFHLLVRAIGRVRALELTLFGEPLPAERALQWGLINRVVADEAVEETALELAAKLASGPPLALRAMRWQAWAALDEDWAKGLARERGLQRTIGQTADAREGIGAFLEKRRPVFVGR